MTGQLPYPPGATEDGPSGEQGSRRGDAHRRSPPDARGLRRTPALRRGQRGLREEVERLRADVDALVGIVEALSLLARPLSDEAGAAHAAKDSAVEDMAVSRSADETVDPAKRWCWRFAGADARRALWHELAGFVRWLNERYQLPSDQRIPPCWYRHGPAVEEITALYAAWLAAFDSDVDQGDGPIAWHDRWLWPCLDRLYGRQFRRCDRQHTARSPVPTRDADDGFEAWVAMDLVADRTETPEPSSPAVGAA